MWAIELLETEEKKLLRTIERSRRHEHCEAIGRELDEVRWALTVLKMAMGHAGETITLPKG